MLGYSSLFVKKTNTFFRAHFEIQNCFETARVVWGYPNTYGVPPNISFPYIYLA